MAVIKIRRFFVGLVVTAINAIAITSIIVFDLGVNATVHSLRNQKYLVKISVF